MGGDHHHVKLPKVPDPSIYVVEEGTDLKKLQDRLAARGLKDPWIRNHVWRDQVVKDYKHKTWVLREVMTYGWKIWVPLVGLTIAVEHFLGIDYHGHAKSHGHGHGHGHDDKHGGH